VLSTGLGWNDTNVWHAWERRELRAEFWKESLKVTIWTTFLDEVKIDLSKEGWKGVGWIHTTHDWKRWRAVAKAVMNRLVIGENSLAE